jgi:hypothetical protein
MKETAVDCREVIIALYLENVDFFARKPPMFSVCTKITKSLSMGDCCLKKVMLTNKQTNLKLQTLLDKCKFIKIFSRLPNNVAFLMAAKTI